MENFTHVIGIRLKVVDSCHKTLIFTSKYNLTKIPNTDALMNVISQKIYVEKYLLLRNDKYAYYEKHWENIFDLLDNK